MNRRLLIAAAAATAALLLAGTLIFLYAPADALQGQVQRIFYLHVASALAAYVCFAVVLGGSLLYLLRQSPRADRWARSAAPAGLVFTTVVLVMGSLWAKPIWGTFWTWDARLTSTLALWVVYASYILVRRVARSDVAASRFAALIGIVGFVDVPIVHFSITWWRTLHPQPVIDNPKGPQLPPEMLVTFGVTALAVILLAIVLMALRYRIELLADEVAELQREEAGEESGLLRARIRAAAR